MGLIFIPRDLNIGHREIHWKPLIDFGQIMCGSSSEMEKLQRLALTVIFFVIPAYAGIQCQSGPRIKSGVTVRSPIRTKFLTLVICKNGIMCPQKYYGRGVHGDMAKRHVE